LPNEFVSISHSHPTKTIAKVTKPLNKKKSLRSHARIPTPKHQLGMPPPNNLIRPIKSIHPLPLDGAKPQVLDAPALNIKQTPMDLESAVLDPILNRHVRHEHLDPGLDVQLGDAHGTGLGVLDGVELVLVGEAHRLERREPGVEDAPHAGVRERGGRPAALRVSAEDDVLDLEVGHRVLDHGGGVDVGGGDDVGDVAVDEDVAWLEAEDGCLWAARVGAAEPDCVVLVGFSVSFFLSF